MKGKAIAKHPGNSTEVRSRRAIFGGTFNPVHCAHLEIARAAQQQFHIDQIVWVPAIAPSYKTNVVAFEHRLVMVQLAIATDPQFTIAKLSDRFAIEILTRLITHYPHSDWFWLIGLDAFTTLPRWVGRDRLAAACDWLIAPRGELADEQVHWVVKQLQIQGIKLNWQLLDRSPSAISSSLVRDRCQANLSIANFVPSPVQTYIQQHRLYQL